MVPVSASFKDMEGTPYAEAASLLYNLGIVEGRGSNYEPEAELTRAEMITYLARILGMDGTGEGAEIFSDVPESHWASINIATAYNMGIANGVGDGMFAPDAPVTFPQAVKLLVSALGYGVQAEALGGYPAGYLTMANRIDLLKGVPQSGVMNRGIMALLAANALDISPSVKADYGTDSGQYTVLEGENLLSYYLHVDTYEGTVTANEMMRTAPGAKVGAGQIAMGDLVFSVGTTNAADLIGQEVTIRAKEENDKLTILHIAAKKGTTVFSVDGEEILPATTTTQLVLEGEDGKNIIHSIAGDAVLVYNGMYKSWQESDLLSDRSTYTFIQNKNEEITVIFQNRYENHVVKSVSVDLGKVFFKDGTSLSLLAGDWNKMQVTKTDGSAATMEDMAEWDVLSVAVGGEDGILRAILSKERVNGMVTEGSEDEVVIGENTYKIAKSLSENILEVQPTVGLEAIYSIDAFGAIAAVNTDTLTKNYAYLVEGSVKQGLDAKAQIKLFTKEGKMEIYTLAEKVRLDDAAPVAAVDVLENGKLNSGGTMIRQLITYELNANNEIDAIGVAENSEGKYDREERLLHFTMDHEVTGTGSRYVGHSSSKFASRYQIADKTIIMVVPKTAGDDSMYKILTKKNLVHGSGYSGVCLYDVDKNNVVSVMVQNIDAATVVEEECQTTAIVLYPTEMLDADGMTQPALRLMLPDGTETAIPVNPDVRVETNRYVTTNKGGIKATLTCIMNESDPYYKTEPDEGTLYNFIPLSALEKGDIIQYETNVYGVISALAVRVRAKRLNPATDMIERNAGDLHLDYAWSSFQYMYGEVITPVESGVVVKSNCISTSTSERHENVERLLTNTAACTYLYERGKDTVRKISSADLLPGDKIAMTHTIAATTLLIAYRD